MCKLHVVIFLCIIGINLNVRAQRGASILQPAGGAVIVTNIDTAVKWYQSIFDLPTVNKTVDPNGEYTVVILESPLMILELLQLKSALPKRPFLRDKPVGTHMTGHFKLAFRTTDMDQLLTQMKNAGITVPRVWTNNETRKRNFIIEDPDGNILQFLD